jgi:hypothetical protein
MSFMRAWSLVTLSLVCSACTVRAVPRGLPLVVPISAKATVRADVHVQAQVQGQVQGQAQAEVVAIQPLQAAPVPEFFGIPLAGAQDVVFVLDVSGSMDELAQGQLAQLRVQKPPPENTAPPPDPNAPPPDPNAPPPATTEATTPAVTQPRKIDVAQSELVEALQRLPAGTRLNVLFFNNDVEGFAPGSVTLDEANRATLISYVWETDATGSTALAPAMRIAFLMNARRVVLLSDGLGNVGGNADSVMRDAREAIRGGVRIDTIGLGRGQDAGLLGALANESGGLYQAL